MVKFRFLGRELITASEASVQAADDDDPEFALRQLCGNVLNEECYAFLIGWYNSANEHDQQQFRLLFQELSDYKRDHFGESSDAAQARPTARSQHSSGSRRSQSATPAEKRAVTQEDRVERAVSFLDQATQRYLQSHSLTQRSIADAPAAAGVSSPARPSSTPGSSRSRSSQRPLRATDRTEVLDELRRRQMLRMVPTAYSTQFRPWTLSPRVVELLGAHKAAPLLDPFGSILSLTAEDRARLAKMPLARSAYMQDYAPPSNQELFKRFCESFLSESSFACIQQWFEEVDDLRRSRLLQVARLLLRPERRSLPPSLSGAPSSPASLPLSEWLRRSGTPGTAASRSLAFSRGSPGAGSAASSASASASAAIASAVAAATAAVQAARSSAVTPSSAVSASPSLALARSTTLAVRDPSVQRDEAVGDEEPLSHRVLVESLRNDTPAPAPVSLSGAGPSPGPVRALPLDGTPARGHTPFDAGHSTVAADANMPRPPSMMSTYQREFAYRRGDKAELVKKAGSENLGDPPYAKSFIPEDLAARPATAYRTFYARVRDGPKVSLEEERQMAKRMIEWEQYNSSTWGKSSVQSPVPLNPETKYRRDYPGAPGSPLARLQEKWDLSMGV